MPCPHSISKTLMDGMAWCSLVWFVEGQLVPNSGKTLWRSIMWHGDGLGRGRGIGKNANEWGCPYLKIKKGLRFLGFGLLTCGFWFLVLWFYGFVVLTVLMVLIVWMVIWFPGFKKYQMSISCFLIDIDLISKISTICTKIFIIFGARLFQNCQKFGGPEFWDFSIWKCGDCFLILS